MGDFTHANKAHMRQLTSALMFAIKLMLILECDGSDGMDQGLGIMFGPSGRVDQWHTHFPTYQVSITEWGHLVLDTLFLYGRSCLCDYS